MPGSFPWAAYWTYTHRIGGAISACSPYRTLRLNVFSFKTKSPSGHNIFVSHRTTSDWQDGGEIMRFLLEHERAASWATDWTGDVLACAALSCHKNGRGELAGAPRIPRDAWRARRNVETWCCTNLMGADLL